MRVTVQSEWASKPWVAVKAKVVLSELFSEQLSAPSGSSPQEVIVLG